MSRSSPPITPPTNPHIHSAAPVLSRPISSATEPPMHHSLKDPSPPHPHPSLSSKNAKPRALGGDDTPSGMPTASAHPASLCPVHGRLLEEGPAGFHQPLATKTVPPGCVVGNARSPSDPQLPPEVDGAHAANPPHKRPTPTKPCSTYLRKSRLSEAMSSQMLT